METRKYSFEEKFKKFINEQPTPQYAQRTSIPKKTITRDTALAGITELAAALSDIVSKLEIVVQTLSDIESKSNNQ